MAPHVSGGEIERPRRGDALVVHLDPGTAIEDALRKFNRKVKDSGLKPELRRREAFVPEPVRRRAKSLRARTRARREAARQPWTPGAARDALASMQ